MFGPVKVPAYADAPLSLSDVTVEAAPSATGQAQPTIRRTFTTREHVEALTYVYAGLDRDDDIVPTAIHVQVLDATGRVAREQVLSMTERDFTRRRAECRITIPTDQLSPGAYLLRIDAAAGAASASKAVRFAVQ